MALAFKLQQSTRQVYTLIGDGEANEGSVWEAIMVATSMHCSNLCVLYDSNRSQLRSMHIPNAAERFSAFRNNFLASSRLRDLNNSATNISERGRARCFLGCRIGSLSEQSGHGPTCCWLDPVANDPSRTWQHLLLQLEQSGMLQVKNVMGGN
jgi:hypothetical protein